MKKYSFDDHPEHKKMLKPWADKWISNAMSTRQIEQHEIPIIKKHVMGLYEAAGCTPPPDHRIIIVPSPFVVHFAGGFASWIWHCRQNKSKKYPTDEATSEATYAATRAATYAATSEATYAATREATDAATSEATDAAIYAATSEATDAATDAATDEAIYAATYAATSEATDAATDAATDEATSEAIYAATSEATSEATDAATYAATSEATDAATRAAVKNREWYHINGDMMSLAREIGNHKALLSCAHKSYKMYQGGNFWSAWVAYLSFFRHVAKLRIDYHKFDHYEKLAELSSSRIMHKEFCIISDRPCKLEVDDQNRPHCEDGPFCAWRDGSCLYSWHGVRVPGWVIESPEKITIEDIQKQRNMEVQRVMIERYGVSRYLMDIDAKIVDMDTLELDGSAPRALMQDKNGNQWLIGTDGSTERVYHMAVENVKTCREAHNQLCGFDESKIVAEC